MKKRLGIIYHSSIFDERRGFIEHSRSLYDEIIIIHPERVIYEYRRDSVYPLMWMDGVSLNDLSMVYFLEYGDCTAQQLLLLLGNLEKDGCPLSTGLERFVHCYNGITDNIGKCYELLQTKGSNVRTNSYLIHSRAMVDETLAMAEKNGDFPLLNKPINGLGGMGIQKLKTLTQARQFILENFDEGERIILLERFIRFVKEWRVYIADNNIICAYEKHAGDNRLLKNLSRGGKMMPIEEDFEYVEEFLLKALPQDCRLGLYGIDVGLSESNHYHLIEINTVFLYRNVLEVTHVDLPRQAVQILAERARILT
ncbi:ATP-grasp domain-containing protein [Fulvivirga sp. 29W222]|uniref:ATP-grasp domain-containing protein n=1 Tax=Fulvivirga marina TaxID=2494733 RepID=A0A937KB90_9BACT|nr:ATP-grasp domain-containing protein [Fulvivirga marina]MBL6445757.1 ATP-grasp domain-containing protein [Fulvivirga marina]